jgi:5-methylcytosine-specific restriction endonuclease McrA
VLDFFVKTFSEREKMTQAIATENKSMILKLNDTDFLHHLKRTSSNELKLTLEVIELLEETDRRSLHLKRGYGSLLEFCVKELRYSESAAYRRISAMRVTRELPQIRKSIEIGSLNLVTVAQAQTFFKQEKKHLDKAYTKSEKLVVLQSLENKSKREAEKILSAKSPALPQFEFVKPISENQTKVTLILNDDLMQKLDQLKNKYSHVNLNPSYTELVELMACELLKRKNQHLATPPVKKSVLETAGPGVLKSKNRKSPVIRQSKSISAKAANRSRYISKEARRFVFQRDQGCCSYQDPETNKKCESKFQLEMDHIHAFSKGGTNQAENLRLVCRAHNQFNWKFAQSNGKDHSV